MRVTWHNNFKKFGLVLVLAAAVVVPAFNSRASLIFTANGHDSSGALDGQATFTFGNGYLTIVLANLVTGSHISQGQGVSGVTFDVAGITVSSTFGENFNGNTVTLASNGSYTSDPADSSLPNWKVKAGNGSIELATTGVIGDGGKPKDLIVPGGTTYVGGIGSHNPYVLNYATFTLMNSDFTANMTVSDVRMLFGTGPDKVLCTEYTPVPEPSTVFAGIVLLVPFGATVIRVLRRKSVD